LLHAPAHLLDVISQLKRSFQIV